MARDFIPRPDSEYASFAANFCEKILAEYEAYGVPLAIAEECAGKQAVFAEKFRAALNPMTRTVSAVSAKNAARAECESAIRSAAGYVRANKNVTPAMRVLLLMNERNSGGRSTRIAAPDAAPLLTITGVMGSTLTVRVTDLASSRALKPRGVQSAWIFAAVGPNASPDVRDWMFVGFTTRVESEITLPREKFPPGTLVLLCAQWVSPRGERGPESRAVSTYTNHELGRPNMGLLAA